MPFVLLLYLLILHVILFEQFYTKTGNCKFGATCKFHHPKDIVIPSAEAVTNENSMTVQPIFSPALLHNTKGLPVRPVIIHDN